MILCIDVASVKINHIRLDDSNGGLLVKIAIVRFNK